MPSGRMPSGRTVPGRRNHDRARPHHPAPVRRRRPSHPVAAPPVPGTAAVVAVPVRPDGKRDDGKPQENAALEDLHLTAFIRIIQMAGVDPTAVSARGNHVAPRPVVQAAFDLHRSSRRDLRDDRIIPARAGPEIRVLVRKRRLRGSRSRNREAKNRAHTKQTMGTHDDLPLPSNDVRARGVPGHDPFAPIRDRLCHASGRAPESEWLPVAGVRSRCSSKA